jgi:hypothetical protein
MLRHPLFALGLARHDPHHVAVAHVLDNQLVDPAGAATAVANHG